MGSYWLLLATFADRQVRLALLQINGQVVEENIVEFSTHQRSQLLPGVVALLKRTGASLAELKGIVFIQASGSFTTVRLAVALGNTLALLLNLPVVSYTSVKEWVCDHGERIAKPGTFVKPRYRGEPNITRPKVRQIYG